MPIDPIDAMVLKVAATAGAAIGFGGLVLSNLLLDRFDTTRLMNLPDFVKQRIRETYSYFGAGVCISTASAVAVLNSPKMIRDLITSSGRLAIGSIIAMVCRIKLFFLFCMTIVFILNFICFKMIGSGAAARMIPYRRGSGYKQLAWVVHSATVGIFVASLRSIGGTNLMKAAWCIAVVSGGFSAVAVCFPRQKILLKTDVAFTVKVFSVGLTAVKLNLPIMYNLQSVLFSGFLLYNAHRVLERAEKTPIHGEHLFDPISNAISIFAGAIMMISVPSYVWQASNVLNHRGTFALFTLNEPVLTDMNLIRSLLNEGKFL